MYTMFRHLSMYSLRGGKGGGEGTLGMSQKNSDLRNLTAPTDLLKICLNSKDHQGSG